MKILIYLVFISLFYVSSGSSAETKDVDYGKFSVKQLEEIVDTAAFFKDEGEKIDYISSKFLGIPYEDHALTGDINTPEVFTINLGGVDCFTYLDYVESLRISPSFSKFEDNLKKVRYKQAVVEFQKRNHFFSDWPVYNRERIKDVTREIGGEKTKSVIKYLNKKKDETAFLPGILVVERNIIYTPSESVNEDVLKKLNTGDYIGFYTDIDGLDVTHTGIIIKKNDKYYLRHASSIDKYKKVVDVDFVEYVSNKTGIIIYRSK